MSRTTDTALAPRRLVVLDVSALDPTAVLRMPEARPPRLAGAGERVRLTKTPRPGLRNRCAGRAFVVPAEAQQADVKAIRAGAKLWGCPATATDDPAAALAWARQRRAEASPDTEEER
ncbi:hypothetical protein AB0M32_08665 [Streptomyces sp. NPDC051985]|uniref:hypothetical protein n=1 Tax=Streptomyces sp. NPDC051985 TaxID=3155807 RepID=UPI00341CC8F1